MKILANLGLIKKTDANLPFGKTIQDETDTQQGTPIVADLMQDLFSNLYRLLELAKITPTNAFDGDSTQYQLIDALKKLPNSMNDIEQVLTLNGTVWSVPFDLTILPNKYIFFARASDDYVRGTTYTFKGIGTTEYSFTSDSFKSGTELLIIIDTGVVRCYPLPEKQVLVYEAIYSQITTSAPTVQTVFKSEHNLVTSVTRNSIGSYKVNLSDYTNVVVEVIPMGAVGNDNLNYPQLQYSSSGISIVYGTGKDCDRTNAFYLKVTKKV